MKHLLLFLTITVSILSSEVCLSQTVTGPAIEFTHDPNGGNRTLRFYNPTAVLNKHGDTLDHTSPPDTLARQEEGIVHNILVKAYPNPTSDFLTIENLSWDTKDRIVVKMFDITGKHILTKPFYRSKEQIPFSNVVPGVYQVHYYLNEKLLTTWKVIKN